jgi:signal transduction histidine kinase
VDAALMLLGPELADVDVRAKHPGVPALVHCNGSRMNQALVNIIQNAVSAVDDDDGHIRISLDVREDFVTLRIEDDGHGMSAEQIATAFDPRLGERDGRIRLRFGLASSRTAVEEAGGSIAIESELGRGTIVTVKLPNAAARQASSATLPSVGRSKNAGCPHPVDRELCFAVGDADRLHVGCPVGAHHAAAVG